MKARIPDNFTDADIWMVEAINMLTTEQRRELIETVEKDWVVGGSDGVKLPRNLVYNYQAQEYV